MARGAEGCLSGMSDECAGRCCGCSSRGGLSDGCDRTVDERGGAVVALERRTDPVRLDNAQWCGSVHSARAGRGCCRPAREYWFPSHRRSDRVVPCGWRSSSFALRGSEEWLTPLGQPTLPDPRIHLTLARPAPSAPPPPFHFALYPLAPRLVSTTYLDLFFGMTTRPPYLLAVVVA